MSKLDQGNNHRVHQRRIYGILAIVAIVLALAAIWNMPSDSGKMESLPAI